MPDRRVDVLIGLDDREGRARHLALMAERREEPAHQRRLAGAEVAGQGDRRRRRASSGASARPRRWSPLRPAGHCGAARDGHGDGRALARRRLQLDRAAMRLDELAGQRQAEPERRASAARLRRWKRSKTCGWSSVAIPGHCR